MGKVHQSVAWSCKIATRVARSGRERSATWVAIQLQKFPLQKPLEKPLDIHVYHWLYFLHMIVANGKLSSGFSSSFLISIESRLT